MLASRRTTQLRMTCTYVVWCPTNVRVEIPIDFADALECDTFHSVQYAKQDGPSSIPWSNETKLRSCEVICNPSSVVISFVRSLVRSFANNVGKLHKLPFVLRPPSVCPPPPFIHSFVHHHPFHVPSFLPPAFIPPFRSFVRSFVCLPTQLHPFPSLPSFLPSFVPSSLPSSLPSFVCCFVRLFVASFVPSFLRSFVRPRNPLSFPHISYLCICPPHTPHSIPFYIRHSSSHPLLLLLLALYPTYRYIPITLINLHISIPDMGFYRS